METDQATPQTKDSSSLNSQLNQVPGQSPATSEPETKKNNKLVILLSFLFLIALVSAGIFAYQNYQLKQQLSPNNQLPPSPSVPAARPTGTLTPSPTADWQIYSSQDNFLTFRYPRDLEGLIPSKQFNISVRSKQETIDEYEKFRESGCPSTCGMLAGDPALLQKQFEILSKMNNLPNCILSVNDKEEIKKDFILFTGAIGNKLEVSGIKTEDGKCGLRIIEFDGFDVSLNNFYYKVSFLVNDKVINISFKIFPYHAFEEVDKLWSDLGFDLINLSCDAACNEKEVEYYEGFSLNNNVEKKVINTYDQIISTIQFTN